ncbi:MAG: L-histidine N(alpha)-methyltransferase [Bauldia litoralis]
MLDRPRASNPDLLEAALEGLAATPKRMSPKWFYDDAGSALFEVITELPEYYPTRTEAGILRDRAGDLAAYAEAGAALVELGSGASVKTRILLDALPQLASYVPLDISAEFLAQAANDLAADYPRLAVTPIVADFMAPIALPEPLAATQKLLFFPGSTIGNLERSEAGDLLARLRDWPNVSAFVLGVDLVKDVDTLVAAYDDAAGVTAAFNMNLLARLNREALADFDRDAFRHEARWNAGESRIEMHLVSRRNQTVRLGGQSFGFSKGESLHTECSHKYTVDGLRKLAADAGWSVAETWTDAEDLFAVAILTPDDGGRPG